MNIKKIILIFLTILSATFTFAQDKIYKTDGSVIEAKVKSVGETTIIYLRFDNLKGPEYTILKSEIDKIKYENGSEESFRDNNTGSVNENGMHHRERKNQLKGKYKPDVIAFAPIQFTENGLAGVSLSYEHAIDKDGIIAFYMPVIADFNMNSDGSSNTDGMYYVMPGFKIYPTGAYGVTKFAVGPSLVIADGQKTTTMFPPNSNEYFVQQSHFVMGIMINQSLNINASPHLYIGGEFGLGYTYIDNVNGTSQGESVLVNFSFKIGFRY